MPTGQEEGAVQTLRAEARCILGWAEREFEFLGEWQRVPVLTGQAMRAATRMELALLGRVRVNRPRPPEHHNTWYYRRAIVVSLPFLGAAILHLSLFIAFPLFSSVWVAMGPDIGAVLLGICLEALLLYRKLSVVDAAPTGQEELDKHLEWMLHPGCLYLFQTRHQRSREEQASYVNHWMAEMTRSQGVLLARLYQDVGKAEEEEVWPALQERLRSVLIGGQPPDPQTAALLLLATFYDLRRSKRLPRKNAVIYRLFAPEEQPLAHQRLTQLLQAAPEMTAQLDPDLYDTLLFIRDQVIEEVKPIQKSGSLWKKVRRTMTG